MYLTQSDVNMEIGIIMDSLKISERKIPNALDVLKFCVKYPLAIISMQIVSMLIIYFIFIGDIDKSGWGVSEYLEAFRIVSGGVSYLMLLATILLSFFFVALFYGNALLYLSIPSEARDKSKILMEITNGLRKISIVFFLFCVCFSIVAFLTKNVVVFCVFPASIFVSIFIYNVYIGSEFMRYGVGPLVETIGNAVRKIR